jgi:hypothetical protein
LDRSRTAVAAILASGLSALTALTGPAARAAESSEAGPAPGEREEVRRNWISVTFSPDLALASGTNVCAQASQATSHYVCLRPDGSRYDGNPAVGNGDVVVPGATLATMRLLVGYDRVVHDNVTVGARVGFAWNGASGGGASFLPLHAEARLGVWLGREPFVGTGVRPYFMFSGGVAQVDAKVIVQVLENGVSCGATRPSDPTSPCTLPNSQGYPEPRTQNLTVYRQDGLGFGAVAFGLQFAPSTRVTLHLALRTSVAFPAIAAVLSPEGGMAVGF